MTQDELAIVCTKPRKRCGDLSKRRFKIVLPGLHGSILRRCPLAQFAGLRRGRSSWYPATLDGWCELSSVAVPFGGISIAKLIYIANTSLDGYTEDQDGGIDWGAPDEEYFRSINSLQRPVGTYLYGRRMYEAMVYWETAPIADQPAWVVDFTNIWRAAEKVVYSKTLVSTSSGRTTVERRFDVEAIRQMKSGDTHDLTVGGADLAAQAFEAGLVDECHLYVWPIAVGGGKHAFPSYARLDLRLLNERRFRSGVVQLHYGVTE